MKVVGIDPGLQICGYACLQSDQTDQRLIEAGVLRTDAALPIEVRLNQIAADIESILKKFEPEITAVEQLYSHYAHPQTSILMGHARGVILQKCAQLGIAVIFEFGDIEIDRTVDLVGIAFFYKRFYKLNLLDDMAAGTRADVGANTI